MNNLRVFHHIDSAKMSISERFLVLGLSVSLEYISLIRLLKAKDIDLVHLHVACEALDVLQRWQRPSRHALFDFLDSLIPYEVAPIGLLRTRRALAGLARIQAQLGHRNFGHRSSGKVDLNGRLDCSNLANVYTASALDKVLDTVWKFLLQPIQI